MCTAFGFGSGWVLNVSIPFGDGQVDVSFDSASSTPILLVYAVCVVGLFLIFFGLGREVVRYKAERQRLDRKKIVVVEARGLRDVGGSSLLAAIPASMEGYREHVLVDMRQGIKDGEIVAPEVVPEKLISLPTDLKRRENGLDRRDLTHVYGGLAPVPFTFLTGVLLDDECAVIVFDWDRHLGVWRELDGSDDGKRFKCTGFDNIPVGTRQVALAVSVSYSIIRCDVRAKVGKIPFVTLDLEGGAQTATGLKRNSAPLAYNF